MTISTTREPIHTARLVLRDITEDDAGQLYELDSDRQVMRYIGSLPALDVAEYRDRIRTVYVPRQAHLWHGIRIVVDRVSGEFLGWVFARPASDSNLARIMGWDKPDEIEIGYRYRQSAWGRGLATEAAGPLMALALEDPTVTAVVACAHGRNAASLRVLEKLGLERVGEVMLPDTSEPTVKLARDKSAAANAERNA